MFVKLWFYLAAILITNYTVSASNPHDDADEVPSRVIADRYQSDGIAVDACYEQYEHGTICIFRPNSNQVITSFGRQGDQFKFLCPYQSSGVVVVYGQGDEYRLFILNRKTDTEYTSGGDVIVIQTHGEIINTEQSSITATMDPSGMHLLAMFANSGMLVTCQRTSPERTSLKVIGVQSSDARHLAFDRSGYLWLASRTRVSYNTFNPGQQQMIRTLSTDDMKDCIVTDMTTTSSGALFAKVLCGGASMRIFRLQAPLSAVTP
jgi:hypothetical protein